MNELKPVAEIAADWGLRYVGSGPLAGLVRTHGLERGQKLFAIPDTHRVVPVELLREIEKFADEAQSHKEPHNE